MKVSKGKEGSKREKKEGLKPVEDSKLGKRKAALKPHKSTKKPTLKNKQAKKDPNKPKRPPSAFFVFLEEFRKIFKEEHPNVKAVSAVGKAAGEKWKSMSPAEKEPYEAKAAKRKSEYEKQMTSYNKKQEKVSQQDDVDEKTNRSPVNGDDEESEEEEEEEGDEEEDDD